jgi:hypothetical protein
MGLGPRLDEFEKVRQDPRLKQFEEKSVYSRIDHILSVRDEHIWVVPVRNPPAKIR